MKVMDNLKDTCFKFVANHGKEGISKGGSVLLRNVRRFDGGMKLLVYCL